MTQPTANRTIKIPVAEIISGGTKSEFYQDLRATLDLSRRAANLAVTACMAQDNDHEAKKPKKLYTYPLISKMFPGCCSVASAVSRQVEKSYLQDRWQMLRGIRSVRSYRSVPWILKHNKSDSTIELSDGESITAGIKLLGGWWTVKLAGGSGHRTQVAGLKRVLKSNDYGDSKIWIDHKHRAILGITCRVPITEHKELNGSMTFASAREHLIVLTADGSDIPFAINCDEAKRWKAESNRRYQRLRQDRKSDANRRKIRDEMNAIAFKMNNRMKTLCHEVASRIVNKAIRSNVAEIKLDLTIKSYIDQFPWSDLAGKIKYKAESAGIRVVDATLVSDHQDDKQPHVYFKFAPTTNRIKIGRTSRSDGGRHGTETDAPEKLVILAVDNQPKAKLASKEKHYHAMFKDHRVVGEWFQSEPILAWLREVNWLGNAGNLSQIMQVLDVSQDAILAGDLNANREWHSDIIAEGCSHNAGKKARIADVNRPALAVM